MVHNEALLRAGIERQRAELGETAEALVAKFDVKARTLMRWRVRLGAIAAAAAGLVILLARRRQS
jgi:hypothetical protein